MCSFTHSLTHLLSWPAKPLKESSTQSKFITDTFLKIKYLPPFLWMLEIISLYREGSRIVSLQSLQLASSQSPCFVLL